jgi:DNA-binding NarL/FixJ family response regulator
VRDKVRGCQQIPYTQLQQFRTRFSGILRLSGDGVLGQAEDGARERPWRMKVLIADDSPLISQRLTRMLAEVDRVTIVGPAVDGTEALRLFEEHRPTVAVLDLQMPGRNGLEVLTKIREQDSSCTVVILTNYDLPEFCTACLNAGANFFLKKSTEFERLVGILNDLLRLQNQKSLAPES